MELSLFLTGAILYLIGELSVNSLDSNIYVLVDEFKNKLMKWSNNRVKMSLLFYIDCGFKCILKEYM